MKQFIKLDLWNIVRKSIVIFFCEYRQYANYFFNFLLIDLSILSVLHMLDKACWNFNLCFMHIPCLSWTNLLFVLWIYNIAYNFCRFSLRFLLFGISYMYVMVCSPFFLRGCVNELHLKCHPCSNNLFYECRHNGNNFWYLLQFGSQFRLFRKWQVDGSFNFMIFQFH